MAQVINTNSISLVAQNNLNKSQSSLSTAIERLSSGLKINSAADNAAGQAITNRFTSSINGLTQASSNASDGISLAQTTEGALDEINDNLQAIRTLTVQSQNGTNSASDLQSIQDEITQRLSEVDRISQQTDFNGVKVLDGSKTSISIQVGSQDGQTISINLQKVNTDSLNLSGFNVDGPASSATTGVASGSTYNSITLSADATVTLSGTSSLTATGLVSDSNGNYFVSGTLTADVEGVGASGAAAYYKLTSNDISITDDGAMTVTVDASDNNLTGVATENPLTTLDKALSTVDDMRSNLGAIQNRFDSTINNLTSTSTNLSEAQSRIQDADYATEVSNMSKAQILQQAGTSVLAQANQVPQTVLSLLQ
ncbi:flagellin [Lonsdalea populi]|uniref:Flagellin n=5 Tax=Lonsdalea populi TaxID=1172565 RepID=A0A3N0U8W7_9GAMM|nr:MULTISPECIES: FliC/FljB family flagellin [Lonsdalea]OSN01705.1 flagellin [Lonsdalea populi]QPQ25411.1 FliC/FljB family flagellin [Lonsdalea populi]RAT17254.1 flagellin [Lonsdalea quercina]RAT28333.1 flagellin [Lonsdalea populi]RAT44774.1 flagellin [Lonsdalea populi]